MVQQHGTKLNKKLISCKHVDEQVSYPVQCTEVDSFSKVETLIEATVVSSWKSDDKLACTLVRAINLIKCKKDRKVTSSKAIQDV